MSSYESFDLSISALRTDALFASALQRSDEPAAWLVRQAVAGAVAAYGGAGCAARVAQAFGEHPETAVTRMRWARSTVAGVFAASPQEPAGAGPGRPAVPRSALAA